MRICSGAGCLRAVGDKVRFCDECKRDSPKTVDDGIRVHTTTDRERYAFLYRGPRWQRLRERKVRINPVCERCNTALVEIVDHIIPAGVVIAQAQAAKRFLDKHAGFYFLSNLQSLCRACHYLKTLEDKTHVGEWPDPVERESRAPRRPFGV